MKRAARVALASGLAAAAVGFGGLGSAWAEPPLALTPRETALVRPERWSWSVGVFNPLTLTAFENLELQAHPLLFLVAPHVVARVPHRAMILLPGQWGFTGEYGLSVPTPGMRLAQGWLFPSWKHGEGQVGWVAVPSAGLVVSRVGGSVDVLTLRVELSAGLPLTHSDAKPLDAPAPLDLVFAPILGRYRARVGALYDVPLGRRLRLRGYGDVYVYGREAEFEPPRSFENVTTRVGIGLDWGVTRALDKRLTFGVAWWNADQHAIDPDTFERVRSNDVWPTLDFIWEG